MNLAAYFDRIGLARPKEADADALAAIQRAHRQAIGFENLDIMLGRTIGIDSASVFAKLVAGGRGGYCFEQNRLFADALVAMGFAVRPLLARVRLGLGPDEVPPRTHVCLAVTIGNEAWLADAGFGGSFVPPLPMADGAQARTPDGAHHRLRRAGEPGSLSGEWRLERAGHAGSTDGRAQDHDDWQPQYTFELAQVAQDDLETGNHWTSTRPGTRFTTLHVTSIALPDGFARLTDREFQLARGERVEARHIADAGEYRKVLRDVFRIELSQAEAEGLPLFIAR